MADPATLTIRLGANDGPRRCGQCTLCCRLLPIKELNKPHDTKCAHQRFGKGCVIYARRPLSCRVWSCLWLSDPEAAGDIRRPDRCHYVVDPMPDRVRATQEGEEPLDLPAVQIWVDIGFPNAWRDPALLAFLNQRNADLGPWVGLVRFNSRDSLVLLPPALTGAPEWIVHRDTQIVASLAEPGS